MFFQFQRYHCTKFSVLVQWAPWVGLISRSAPVLTFEQPEMLLPSAVAATATLPPRANIPTTSAQAPHDKRLLRVPATRFPPVNPCKWPRATRPLHALNQIIEESSISGTRRTRCPPGRRGQAAS